MEMFAFYLCVVTGLALGDLKRTEIGLDDVKVNAREAASLDTKGSIMQDQYFRSKDVNTTTQCLNGDSNETETSEKPSSVVAPMTVIYDASKAKQNEQRLYFGTRVMDLRSFLKHSHRHPSAKKRSIKVKRSLPRSKKTRRLFRRKRKKNPRNIFDDMFGLMNKLCPAVMSKMDSTDRTEKELVASYANTGSASPDLLAKYYAERDAERQLLKEKVAAAGDRGADMIDTYKSMRNHSGDWYQLIHGKFPAFFEKPSSALTEYENMKREEYAYLDRLQQELIPGQTQQPIQETKTEETQQQTTQQTEQPRVQEEVETVTIRPVDTSRIVAASKTVMEFFLYKLPIELMKQVVYTDRAEQIVLENYAVNHRVPSEALDAYNSAKKKERQLLKRMLTEVPIILPTYKALRKGVAWNYTRLNDKFREFFQQPSDALTEYEALKRDESASLDSFLAEPIPTEDEEDTKNVEAEETAKRKIREAEIGRSAVNIQDQPPVILHN